MRLLLVAPPGAGKGTQARLLASHFGIAHLASGDLLRQEVAARTEIGQAAAAFLARGDLVPDLLVIEMLRQPIIEAAARRRLRPRRLPADRSARPSRRTGSPRRSQGIELQAVIHLLVDRDELRRRLVARAENEGRVDDNEATIAHRLEVYDTETAPILAFYANRGLVVDVDGNQPVEAVFSDIVKTVEGVRAGLR